MAFTSDSPTTAIIDQSNRRILEGYPFMIDCAVLGEDNVSDSNSTVVTWYRDGESLSTGASYTVEKSTVADTGMYYCVVTNAFGSVTSDTVNITIVHPGDDQFGVNLIKNGDAKDGQTGWTPVIGNFIVEKFWAKSGDRNPYGYW